LSQYEEVQKYRLLVERIHSHARTTTALPGATSLYTCSSIVIVVQRMRMREREREDPSTHSVYMAEDQIAVDVLCLWQCLFLRCLNNKLLAR
jgi:hypothetical protein